MRMANETVQKGLLSNLEIKLFEKGLYPRSVTEITGHSNSGKTYLAYHLVIKCIMPKVLNNIEMNGCESQCIYISCLQPSCVYEMATLIENAIVAALRDAGCSRDEVRSFIQQDKTVLKCLKRLTIFKCYSYAEYLLCCHNVGLFLKQNSNVQLVILDSINAFDFEGPRSGRHRYRNIEKNLDHLTCETENFNVAVVYTKLSQLAKRQNELYNCSEKTWRYKDTISLASSDSKFTSRIPLSVRFFLFDDEEKKCKGILTEKGAIWYTFSKAGRLKWLS
ncbi:DNA repair protein RAD51 homolog 3-like isoform X2 [Artemia franciscana]|uniref:Rad51-like C-terminal domain-containing protein n=1 Tax=Artemia franciscana TaxID=6661 RepID=A0AA88IE93_ARTSF|nr:hypothetical protein QYM36_000249 [Artemia franciscana]